MQHRTLELIAVMAPKTLKKAELFFSFLSLVFLLRLLRLCPVTRESKGNPRRPLVDYLLHEKKGEEASAILKAIDDAAKLEGVKPFRGSAISAGLWYRPQKGLALLDSILSGQGQEKPEGTAGTGNSCCAKSFIRLLVMCVYSDAPLKKCFFNFYTSGCRWMSSHSSDKAQGLLTVKMYASQLLTEQPEQYGLIMTALNWPADKLPETDEEARLFLDVARREYAFNCFCVCRVA